MAEASDRAHPDRNGWVPWLVLLLAMGLGATWRIQGTADTPLFGDEYHSLRLVDEPTATIFTTYDSDGSHVALPLLQRASQALFGPGVGSFRLPALTAGLLGLVVCYPVARGLVGPAAALLTTVALALSPMHIYYSRFARTYAIALLLGLLLVHALRRATSDNSASRARWIAVTLLAAMLPYVHLTSIGFVGALALLALWQAWRVRQRARDLVAPAVSFGAAGVLALLLYLPAWESLSQYLARNVEAADPGPFGAIDVATLLAGGRVAGIVGLIAVPVAAAAVLAVRSRDGLWLLAAAAGPLLGLLAFRPYGMAYAYARYLFIALPFLLMLVLWLLVSGVSRVVPGARGRHVAVALGLALIGAGCLAGPRSPWRSDDGPFSNTYLALRPLPAFDRPYPGTPGFYESLARDTEAQSIIEMPRLLSRAVLLYRNYQLQHGKQTLLGVSETLSPTLRNGPYVRVGEFATAAARADYLVLHLDVERELASYWRFVYEEAWPGSRTPGDESLMARHRDYRLHRYARLDRLVPVLRARFGEPAFEDRTVIAWRLR